MNRERRLGGRPFRPLIGGGAPGRRRARRPRRFTPLAFIFRRARHIDRAPGPTLVTIDGARLTIAPRIRLHLHHHLQIDAARREGTVRGDTGSAHTLPSERFLARGAALVLAGPNASADTVHGHHSRARDARPGVGSVPPPLTPARAWFVRPSAWFRLSLMHRDAPETNYPAPAGATRHHATPKAYSRTLGASRLLLGKALPALPPPTLTRVAKRADRPIGSAPAAATAATQALARARGFAPVIVDAPLGTTGRMWLDHAGPRPSEPMRRHSPAAEHLARHHVWARDADRVPGRTSTGTPPRASRSRSVLAVRSRGSRVERVFGLMAAPPASARLSSARGRYADGSVSRTADMALLHRDTVEALVHRSLYRRKPGDGHRFDRGDASRSERALDAVLYRATAPPGRGRRSAAADRGGPIRLGEGAEKRQVPPAAVVYRAPQQTEARVKPPTPTRPRPPTPMRIDLERISDEVFRRIERRARIERVRHGLQ